MTTGHLCDLVRYIRKIESTVINYGRWRWEDCRISTSAVGCLSSAKLPNPIV
jgi:hypothetical protein